MSIENWHKKWVNCSSGNMRPAPGIMLFESDSIFKLCQKPDRLRVECTRIFCAISGFPSNAACFFAVFNFHQEVSRIFPTRLLRGNRLSSESCCRQINSGKYSFAEDVFSCEQTSITLLMIFADQTMINWLTEWMLDFASIRWLIRLDWFIYSGSSTIIIALIHWFVNQFYRVLVSWIHLFIDSMIHR